MSRGLLAILITAAMLSIPLAQALPPPDPVASPADDGSSSMRALIDDAPGGTWREFPVSDAGIAAFTNALASHGVTIDSTLFAAEVRGVGAYVHSWTGDDGAPYVTIGTYFITDHTGKVREPLVIVENVTDLGNLTDLVQSVVSQDSMPMVAEMAPHVFGLAAPDVVLSGILGGIGAGLAGELALSVLADVESTDASNGAVNVPPEAYSALENLSWSVAQLAGPMIWGQFGLGGVYADAPHNMTYDWTDRPEVRFWFVHKSEAGHDAWAGIAVSRTGDHSGDAISSWSAWKRVSVGPAARIDGVVTEPAAIYVRDDVTRSYDDAGGTGGPTSIADHDTFTAGVAADGTDTPLAQVHMDGTRDDSGNEGPADQIVTGTSPHVATGEATYLPEDQQEDWSAGVVAAGAYTPLVGARTTSHHHGHADVDNLGNAEFEWESQRETSAGIYVLGDYTPVVGAREWTERLPIELYAVSFATNGPGDQTSGDLEASVGTYVQGAYTPLAGGRIDDDFQYHLHDHRTMLSAGTYLQGTYEPLVGTTYDGVVTALTWALAREVGAPEGNAPWQTSAGTFTLAFYRPLVGARFVPATHDGAGASQESYQLGIYPALYDPFIPVASVDYSGDSSSLTWALAFEGGQLGGAREGGWHTDVVAYTPGPFAFPLVGARYTTDAPDGSAPYEMHASVGVWGPNGFVPIVGASYRGDGSPVLTAESLAIGAATRTTHENAIVTAGIYDPTTGQYDPVATGDTSELPL